MDYREQIEKITDRVIRADTGDKWMNIHYFDWSPGVGLYGIWEAYRATGREAYLKFLTDWADRHLEEAYDRLTVNSAAPMLTILELWKVTGKERYLQVCRDIADRVLREAPRTREGGLEHTVTEAVPGFSEQIWADTLFMVCLFLIRLGQYTGERSYLDFGLEQFRIHHRLLFDPEADLYFHGWNCAAGNHMSAVHWGRANAWIIYATGKILEECGQFRGREELEEKLRRHVRGLKAVQLENGAFATVLEDPTAYPEISATGGIAAGICRAIRLGLVGEEYLPVCRRAAQAVSSYILEDGTVDSVSGGTPIMENAEAYKNIEITPTLYGQALATLCLCEMGK